MNDERAPRHNVFSRRFVKLPLALPSSAVRPCQPSHFSCPLCAPSEYLQLRRSSELQPQGKAVEELEHMNGGSRLLDRNQSWGLWLPSTKVSPPASLPDLGREAAK